MKTIILATACLILLSCKSQNCNKSNTYYEIEKYIDLMDENHEEAMYLYGDYMFANLLLSEITKIESNANYGDVSEYINEAELVTDIKNWKNWLNNQGCDYSQEEFNNNFKKIKKNTDWIE